MFFDGALRIDRVHDPHADAVAIGIGHRHALLHGDDDRIDRVVGLGNRRRPAGGVAFVGRDLSHGLRSPEVRLTSWIGLRSKASLPERSPVVHAGQWYTGGRPVGLFGALLATIRSGSGPICIPPGVALIMTACRNGLPVFTPETPRKETDR